ncbi:MAG: DUF4184 family protein [Culicoidibacterales bacterium]
MAFTVAHTICAIPFYKKRWFSVSAITLGLIAPDLAYFILFQKSSDVSTKLPGFLWFTLPASFVLWWTWQAIIAPHVYEFLAVKLPERSQKPETYQVLWVLSSFFLGIALHHFVDSFAEPGGLWVEMFPAFFDQEILTVQVTTWFQYGLSAMGTISLVVVVLYWWFKKPKLAKAARNQLLKELGICFVGSLFLTAATFVLVPISPRNIMFFVIFTLVRMISMGVVTLVSYILITNWQQTGYLLVDRDLD